MLVVTFVAAACAGDSNSDTAAPAPDTASDGGGEAIGDDDVFPYAFSSRTLDGGMIDAGDFEGQDLVLWFWAPW